MPDANAAIGVIIAAWNAAPTIGRAIASALAQPEVVEVVVVDDASTDETVAIALAADDDCSGRLRVISQSRNKGPAAARNRAIDETRAPLVAILDADDFFLPNRFRAMLAEVDWDVCADNIAFVDEQALPSLDLDTIRCELAPPLQVSAANFVERSISRPDRAGRELAFAKPLIRRKFLEDHALRYDEQLRLAEDYDFYLRLLQAGARFIVTRQCGYVAVGRRGSLSRDHTAVDLQRFEHVIERALLRCADADLSEQLRIHLRQTRRRRAHRELLDRKAQSGALRAIANHSRAPGLLVNALIDVARDKIGNASRHQPVAREIDYLI